MSNTKYGTFEQLINTSNEEVKEISLSLKKLIMKIHPTATEVVRLGDKAAAYGWGEKKMSEAYVYIMPLKNHVNLGFFHGSSLQDAHNMLEGTGKRLRHVKIKKLSDISISLEDLIISAKENRKKALSQ